MGSNAINILLNGTPPLTEPDMTSLPTENPLFKLLEKRVSPAHLKQRLGIELDHEQKIFGQGPSFFHIENWYSIHSFIRNTLRLSLLHRRGQRNALNLQVTRNAFTLPQLPAAFEGFTILHISDLHIDVNEQIPRVLAKTISELEYDLCVITGDLRARTFGPYTDALDAMKTVCNSITAPVYTVLGNHDSIQMVPGLEAMGINVLLNESVVIERQGELLHLAGIDDPHYYEAHNIEKAANDIPSDSTSVLLSHSPEPYRNAAHADFDVFLCGHTHGGQICLPGGIPLMRNARCPRKFCNGSWDFHNMQGYTSKGSGVSVVDVRYNCPPEVTLHTLQQS